MKKHKKPILFYIVFGFSSLAIFVNAFQGLWINELVWVPIAVGSFLLIKKRNKIIKKETERETEALKIYKEKYANVLSSNENIDSIDKNEIITRLNLSEEEANQIDIKSRKSCLDDIVKSSIIDGMLSPLNNERIHSAAKRLNVNLSFDKQTSQYLDKLKLYWKIENDQLEKKSVDISLQKDEVCYYSLNCKWMELRKITKSVSYSGVTGSFKIAKGVRYRVGNFKPQRITVDKLIEIDNGDLYVTNKRIIFMGAKKNSNIKFQNILAITPYSDGVGIEKDSGKSPILKCNEADILARILSKLNN